MKLRGRDEADRQLITWLRAYPDAPARPAPLAAGFWERAARGGVAVLLARQPALLPQAGAVLAEHKLQAALAMRSRTVLAGVLEAFGQAKIECAPLKGPLLGARLYGDFTWRPTSDIDVLVREADLDRALEALYALGASRPEPATYRYYRRHHHHIDVAFRGVVVEVHFRASANFGVFLPSEPLLDRSSWQSVGSLATRVLEPGDELLFLAVHAAAHNLVRDILLLDLKLLARRAAVDWGALHARARTWHLERAVGVALVAARERVGLDASAMDPTWRRRSERRARLLPDDLPLGDTEDPLLALRGFAAQALLTDSAATAARSLAHHGWRVVRRRLQRTWPQRVPADWAG